MKDTEASLRKEWNDLFDRIVALGTARGQKDITQEIARVVRVAQTGAIEQTAKSKVVKRKPKSKKRMAVKKYVEQALKDNTDHMAGMTPPEIRAYAKSHFSKDLRTESIRQTLIRMNIGGLAHKGDRGWHHGPKPQELKQEESEPDDMVKEANEAEAASNESSTSSHRYSILGGQNV